MRMRDLCIAGCTLLALAGATRAQTPGAYGIGRTATPAEIAGWNIDVDRDGNNLPPGSGSVSHGHEVFDQQCAACHGAKGEGGLGDRLVGGQGTIATPKPVRTVGSFWPYAPTLFDYIRRAMPQNAPQSLDANDVYAVSAYILNLNGLLPADATLDARTLSAIKMPNRGMFVGDPRPDVENSACMTGC
jgi:mono/diheme cytochrome c family protein